MYGKFALIFTFLLLAGCSNYYKVSDPVSGTTYYSKKLEQKEKAVIFRDARTGNQVTMQNSTVEQISSAEFKQGLAQTP